MKALLLLCIGFFLAVPAVLAQDTTIHGKNIRLHRRDRIYTVEHLTFQDGKLYHNRMRRERVIDTAFILPNGIEIHPDGQYRALNGLIYNLKDGEYMDMQGNRYSSLFNFNSGKKMKQKEIDKTAGLDKYR
jgi:hypothetical protein